MPEVADSILGADAQFSFFFLVEKKLMTVKKFLSVAKMAPTIYETETCGVAKGEIIFLTKQHTNPQI